MSAEPRTVAQRRRDTEHRLAHDTDVWVASSSATGDVHLVPLSFAWDGTHLLLATPADSRTGTHLASSGRVRLGLGPTRDVTMIDGSVDVLDMAALPAEQGDEFASQAGFDPRTLDTEYRWFRVTPERMQAWREVNELPGRLIMRDGAWLG